VRRAALATGLALAALAAPAARADLPPLVTGVTDNDTAERSPEGRPLAYERIRAARASVIRVFREWSAIERVKPPDLATARNPDWSGYDWGETDAILRDAAAARLRPLLSFLSAPAWAEGPGRPPVSDDAPAGTWRPSPAAYAAFAGRQA